MNCHDSRRAWVGGTWLIGLGILFATRTWWPGILVLFGIALVVHAFVTNQGMARVHGGLWAILIGVWVATRFNMAFLLISLGVFVILRSVLTSTDIGKKPYFDNRLE